MQPRLRILRQVALTLVCLVLGLVITLPQVCPVMSWSGDPTQNTPICTATGDQTAPQIIADGYGGAIIAWQDSRGGEADVYAQRVDSSGVVKWTTDGVAVSRARGMQYCPRIISDGLGGAIITWEDYRGGGSPWSGDGNPDIYAQRLDSSGSVRWTADGVPICTATGDQTVPQLISDGFGGATITWQDARGADSGIYAQRVNSWGVVQWPADGISICTATGGQGRPQIVSNGSGGAIVTWEDARGSDSDIYAQWVNSSGAVQWTANGVSVCAAMGDQTVPQLIPDGSGGAVITWQDARGDNADIFTQRVNSLGVVQWTADGIAICTAPNDQIEPQLISDGSGGAIIMSWQQYYPIAQRVNSSGTVQWTPDGVPVVGGWLCCDQQITSDGLGGAIITFTDLFKSPKVEVQRLGSGGVVEWSVIFGAGWDPQCFPDVCSDGSGGAIIAWQGSVGSSSSDIYAQKVRSDGTLDGDASTHTMSGRVTLSGTGLQGVTVSLTGAASRSTTTDASGNYSFAGLANGSYTITPSMSGYSFSPAGSAQVVSGANVTGVNFAAMATTHSISGTVTLSGAGLQGVTVSLTGAASASTTTDASGNYTLSGLANGSYTVTPTMSGYAFSPSSSAQVVSGADMTGVDFTATVVPTATYGISGEVTLSGAGLQGVTMTVTGAASQSATADASGNYTLTGLANGSYTVTPSMSGYTFSPSSSAQVVSGADITGVNFTATAVPPATYGISGTITLSGSGLQGVTVSLSGAASISAATDASGNYAFTGLAKGSYTVMPTMSGYTFDPASGTLLVDGVSITGVNFAAAAIAEGAPPAVTTADADNIKADSARLHGGLSSPGTAVSVTLSFVWGTGSGSYPNETTNVAQSTAGTFYYDLSGLSPGTTYYYKAKAAANGVSFGVEKSFTTAVGGSPAITGLAANSGRPGDELTVTISGANLSGATAVDFGAKITVSDLTMVSDTEISVKIAIDQGAEAGKRDVSVTTPQGTVTAPGVFTVNEAGTTVHLWVYLLAGVGGIAALGIVASLGLRLMRRRTT